MPFQAIFYLFILLLTISSCTKIADLVEDFEVNIPICVIENFEKDTTILKVIAINNNGKILYHLNTDFALRDGAESIINEDCENVCTICGECFIPRCVKNLQNKQRKIILQR